MAEPRMRTRAKGQQFSTADLEAFLTAFGDAPGTPLPATVTALDNIITDFIIETCHLAAQSATYSHRQKIKVEDFKFALRRDPKKLGRLIELLSIDRDIKHNRRAFNVEEEELARKEAAQAGRRGRKRANAAAEAGEDGEGDEDGVGNGEVDGRKKKRRKPGRKKKVRDEDG